MRGVLTSETKLQTFVGSITLIIKRGSESSVSISSGVDSFRALRKALHYRHFHDGDVNQSRDSQQPI